MATDGRNNVDQRGEPPFPVTEYIEHYSGFIYSGRFGDMRLAGDQLTIPDVKFGTVRDTAVGAWNKCWLHISGRCASMARATHYNAVDSLFVRCREELDYERLVGDVVLRLCDKPDDAFPSDLGLFCFSQLFDCLFFASHWSFWARDFDFEYRMRTGERHLLVGWHNVEIFALPPSRRHQHYVVVPEWWRLYEACCIPTVPTLFVIS